MKKDMPSKQIPVLELEDGTRLAQSMSILRYVGRKHGYYPADPLEAHMCDYLIDCYNDKAIGIFVNLALPAKLLEESPFNPANKALPEFIEFLEPYLGASDFLRGSKLTIADFMIGGLYVNSILNKDMIVKEKWTELM